MISTATVLPVLVSPPGREHVAELVVLVQLKQQAPELAAVQVRELALVFGARPGEVDVVEAL